MYILGRRVFLKQGAALHPADDVRHFGYDSFAICHPCARLQAMSEESEKEVTLEAGTHWMCSCGKSANYPFCDGAHKGSGKGPEKLVLEEAKTITVKRPE